MTNKSPTPIPTLDTLTSAQQESIAEFVASYALNNEDMYRLTMLCQRIDLVVLETFKARHGQRIGQWFFNYVFESCMLPVKANTGFRALHNCTTRAEMILVLRGFVSCAHNTLMRYTGSPTPSLAMIFLEGSHMEQAFSDAGD